MRRQCELLGLNRSCFYYEPARETEENLTLMKLIDMQYLETPYYGSRRMAASLKERGYPVNRKRVQRLMGVMGHSRQAKKFTLYFNLLSMTAAVPLM